MISKYVFWRIKRISLFAFVRMFWVLSFVGGSVEAADKYWVVGGPAKNYYWVPSAGTAKIFPNGHVADLTVKDLAGAEYDPQANAPVTLNPTTGTAGGAPGAERLPAGSTVAITPTANSANAGECKVRLKFNRDKLPGGTPSTWETVDKWVVFTVKTETQARTPADRTRKTIGVGEAVTLTLQPPSVTADSWALSGDGVLTTSTSGDMATYGANDTASTAPITVTATLGGTPCAVDFTVLAPSGITFVQSASLNGLYPAGQAGCGMICTLTFNPTTVSFENLQWKEDSGLASNVEGYFADPFFADQLNHTAGGWANISADNKAIDTVSYTYSLPNGSGGYPVWSDGGWDWDIPNRYRVFCSAGNGYIFQHTTQKFRIQASGATSISKQGDGAAATIDRTP